ncbi:macoilin-2 isoform X2 [Coccinella septempunctata]|uniref:macoilin-2 isoform X2 n=1 Tax=Coccinella septempunctata TaxID=41139 RepID=UPI001D0876FB|nr:macoilin-2 isoform X2 [Coccinella septempunctata]
MKRRNVEIGKMRRPIKRNKITEGIYGSTLLYLKFLSLWALVILADFILEFRFEFLWPFYLLLRSVYDSFKYQGLAFSIFFVCIALTSDMLCFFFIPVHWLFFAASTYVWVQYVWHTDKGICAPTIVLWMLFVYLETAVRLRDIKHMPGHLDLCRPFAAHCIGYPVVTLGFGFKSYIGFRMRQRKQRDVAKENEFYMQLIQQALPHDTMTQNVESVENAIVPVAPPVQNITKNSHNNRLSHHDKNSHIPNGHIANGIHNNSHGKSHRKSLDKSKNDQNDHEQSNKLSDKHDKHIDRQQKQHVNHSHTNGSAVGAGADDNSHHHNNVETESKPAPRKRDKREAEKDREAAEYLQRIETESRRLRSDLQNSRASEQELRLQVAALTTSEKVLKGEISALQREVEELQQRLQNVQSSRTTEKQNLASMERRLAEERRLRSNLESQLNQERKSRKQEEARAAQVAAQTSRECTEQCKSRRRELENELTDCRSALHWAEDKYKQIDRENVILVEQLRDTDILMSALSAMQEKNTHLENSLSAETRIKLDLFSALGEAKRQVEIRDSANRAQEKEIEELKSKIAQVLAVMPNDTFGGPASTTNHSRVRLAESPPGSTLDPNATAYTPKGSLVTSTEA